jgi:hypothetical protein
MIYKMLILTVLFGLTACGKRVSSSGGNDSYSPPPAVGSYDPVDDAIVVGRAIVFIENNNLITAVNKKKMFNPFSILIPTALAYVGSPPSASVSITYTNAAASSFSLTPGAITTSPTVSMDGLSLNFGNISIGDIDDNSLKKCTTVGQESSNGNQKCNTAIIRVYSPSGGADGVFCNAVDAYCVPMNADAGTFGVGVANAKTVLTHSIPGNVNRLRSSQFASTSWPLAVDISNAGSGDYAATVIIEYALKRN